MANNVEITKNLLQPGGSGLDVIFLGNPGVGKSTIASTLSGTKFVSGISFGEGLTQELTWNEDGHGRNIRWADTPGLADIDLREKAAAAITQALKDSKEKNRGVKLIFVCYAQSGRINPLDIQTINDVMTSIKLPNGEIPGANSYTVVFNKFERAIFESPKFNSIVPPATISGRNRMEKYSALKKFKKSELLRILKSLLAYCISFMQEVKSSKQV